MASFSRADQVEVSDNYVFWKHCINMPHNQFMNTMRSGPATSSHLNKTWLMIMGKDSWKATGATVFSCDWTDLSNQIDSRVGHYHVVYSYQVDGTFYTGRFADYGMQDEEYFKPNDVFQVRYNPGKPAQSRYPD